MVQGTIGPLHVEILTDEVGSFLVDGVDQLLSFRPRYTFGCEPANLIFSWRKKKDPQGIRSIAKMMLRSSADDDAVPFLSGPLGDLPGDALDAIGVEAM